MITVRQIERLFNNKETRRLYRELIEARPEGAFALEVVLGRTVPTAALAIIRMDELSQSHLPIYQRFLNVVLTSQQPDGGWGEPMTTALCIRALLCGGGHGRAVERGLIYLANLQKTEGIWPREPIRRIPADAFASAFVLLQLGDRSIFRRHVRFAAALDWFANNVRMLDPESRRLWDHASVKCHAYSDRLCSTTPLFTSGRPAA